VLALVLVLVLVAVLVLAADVVAEVFAEVLLLAPLPAVGSAPLPLAVTFDVPPTPAVVGPSPLDSPKTSVPCAQPAVTNQLAPSTHAS
jgi:hypothetical protein